MQLQANAMLTGWEWIHWLVQGWWWLFSEVQMGQKDKTGLSAAGGRQGWGYLACVTTMVAEWSDGAWEEQMEGDEAGGKERGGRAQRHKQERYTRKGKTRGTRITRKHLQSYAQPQISLFFIIFAQKKRRLQQQRCRLCSWWSVDNTSVIYYIQVQIVLCSAPPLPRLPLILCLCGQGRYYLRPDQLLCEILWF